VESAAVSASDMGTGAVSVTVTLPRALYYQTISARSGFEIRSDGDLMQLLSDMSAVKKDYDRVKDALRSVRDTGYGVVMPAADEMELEEPQIVRRGGRYTVRLKARAPAIHMLKTSVETEVTPALGGSTASEEIMGFLLQGFDGDMSQIWKSNIFGKSMYDIAGEGLDGQNCRPAGKCPQQAAGDPAKGGQRGQRRIDLYNPIKTGVSDSRFFDLIIVAKAPKI
jgi:stage IV sporulation protein A